MRGTNITSTKRYKSAYSILAISLIVLFFLNLAWGAVNIPLKSVITILFGGDLDEIKPSWIQIILYSRIPQSITALFAGAALAVSGLMLQTLFKNPLAGPSILGISDGANLGVAIVMLYFGGVLGFGSHATFGGYFAIIIAAFMGAGAVLAIIIWFSARVKSNVMLLIIGIMVGYLVSSMISILNFQSSADKVHNYVMWGMGNFSGISMEKLPYFLGFTIFGIIIALLLIKPLNALLLGEMYAANLGIKIKRVRILILLSTGILTASVTAFCGPISFIGLAVPHVARLVLGTSNHKDLVPVTLLAGAVVALLCSLATSVYPGGVLPLNAVTPIVGAPVIIYVIVNRKNIQYFN